MENLIDLVDRVMDREPTATDWINFLYGEQSEPDEERIEDYDE